VEAMIETLAMLLIGLAIGFMFKKLGMQSIKAKLDNLLSIYFSFFF
jgi:uncharacterized membrane-anchored protein YhcB (DUF1043 family)